MIIWWKLLENLLIKKDRMYFLVITGANGFIGSNLCEFFLKKGYHVCGLCRNLKNDTILNLKSFKKFEAYEYDSESSFDNLKNRENITIIHTAWVGVGSSDRNNDRLQLENLNLGFKILDLASKIKAKRIIGLGSQAEYGIFEGRVNEEHKLLPNSSYGFFKVIMSKMLETFSESKNIEWQWLRLFSIYGKNESPNWFFTNIINKLKKDEDIPLTLCEQKYDYLFTDDLGFNIENIIVQNKKISGIFNLSTNQSVALKEIAVKLKTLTKSNSKLLFGELPYREGQIMHMEGDSTKFESTFGLIISTFESNIEKILN